MSQVRVQAGGVAAEEGLFAATLAQSSFAILWLDERLRIVALSPALRDRLGPGARDWPGRGVLERLTVRDAGFAPALASAIADGADAERTFAAGFTDASGRTVPVTLSLQRVLVDGSRWLALHLAPAEVPGEAESVQRLQRDVLEDVAGGRPLRSVLDLLCRRVEALAPEVICTVVRVDPEGRLRPLAGPMMPAAYSAAIDGLSIGPAGGSCGTAAWRGEPVVVTDIAHDPLWDGFRSLVLPLGLAACWSSPIFARDGRVLGSFALYYREARGPSEFHVRMVDACVHLCSLALEHEEAQAQIRRLAYFDALTGLPNRMLLRDRAGQAIAQATRSGSSLVLLYLDIDRFKMVNDSLGHPVGDRVLQEVGQRLNAAVRESDTLARIGGDEFVVLLPDCTTVDAVEVSENLLRSLATRIEIGDLSYSPTLSIGISVFPDDAQDFDTLLKNADIAMYRAKEDGRACFRFFQREMNDTANRRLEMEIALRTALAQGELRLHYQPQVRLGVPGLHGVEALLRWNHPDWGAVSPAVFIPLAEDCGLIPAIDAWVLETACAQLADWTARGVAVPTVSVNVSAARFVHDDLPRHVLRLLQRHSLAAHRLTLEITERLMMANVERTLQALDALHEMGVRLSVDDFGTGYSSLSYLKRFPVGEIKLDQSFVRDLEIDAGDRALATAVIRIGASLRQTVVAEGVETAGQYRFLLEQDCAVAQGYYFAPPLSAADFEAWLGAAGRLWVDPWNTGT